MINSNNHNLDPKRIWPDDADIKLNINSRSLSVYEQYLKKKTQEITLEQSKKNNEHNVDLSKNTSVPKKTFRNNISNHVFDDLMPVNDSVINSSQSMPTEQSTYQSVETPDKSTVNNRNTNVFFGGNVEPPKAVPTEKATSSSKLLVGFASFCSLLLVGVVLVIFNATNSLADLTDRLSSVNNQVSEVSNSISVIGSQNSLANAQAIADERAANAATARSLAAVKSSIDNIAINTKQDLPMTTRVRSLQIGDTGSNAMNSGASAQTVSGVSYNDFTEESLTTLYRESGE